MVRSNFQLMTNQNATEKEQLTKKLHTSDSRHLQADSRQTSSALNSKGNIFGPPPAGDRTVALGSSLLKFEARAA